MDPKDKAEELNQYYFDVICAPHNDTRKAWIKARQCAIIAVKEIMKDYEELIQSTTKHISDNVKPIKGYWQEVLKDLEE